MFQPGPILHQSEHHADTGERESEVIVVGLAQKRTRQGPNDRAQVDAHVKDREGRVSPCAPLGVQVGHNRADARLQQTCAEGDQKQADEEQGVAWHRHGKMTRGDDPAAHIHSLALSPEVVGNPSPRKRQQIDQPGVEPVDRPCGTCVEPHARVCRKGFLREIENEERPHAVIREALPQFGKEEGGKTSWVSEKSAGRGGGRRRSAHGSIPEVVGQERSAGAATLRF